jgi:hypothetical protein
MALAIICSFLMGVIVTAMIASHKQCPRRVIGYSCQGPFECDHRESSYYEAKRTMALNKEERDNISRGQF